VSFENPVRRPKTNRVFKDALNSQEIFPAPLNGYKFRYLNIVIEDNSLVLKRILPGNGSQKTLDGFAGGAVSIFIYIASRTAEKRFFPNIFMDGTESL
jgi:hypothetical protein